MFGERLFDHLVGDLEKVARDHEAKRFGRLQIDNQLKFCWLLHRQFRRFGAFQDFV